MHKSEPWTLSKQADGVTLILAGDKIVVRLKNGAIHGGQDEDAERIVACINACRGVPTAMLNRLPLTGLLGLLLEQPDLPPDHREFIEQAISTWNRSRQQV